MEFHQIRYFLALGSTLNFTRAAELCNVSQPALTRAIKQLEDELGGDLIRREGRLSHLTGLGRRVLPMLRESYQKSLSAKALARACVTGDKPMLGLAVSSTVNLERLSPVFDTLLSRFADLEMQLLRGSNEECFQRLKLGEVEFVFADVEANCWERLDCWPFDKERFALALNARNPLNTKADLALDDLTGQAIICLPQCGLARELIELLPHPQQQRVFEVATIQDVITLLKLNAGVALLPAEAALPDGLVLKPINGARFEHLVQLWAVGGRRRSKVGRTLVELVHCQSRDLRAHALYSRETRSSLSVES